MGYIGNQTSNSFTSMDKQSITGNGTTGPYTLTHAVANEQEIEVFVNNVRQEPGVAYTVSGNAMTMTGNVAASDDFYVVFQGKAIQTVVPGDDTITTAMLKDGIITSAKVDGTVLTSSSTLSSSNLSGALPALDGSALTGVGTPSVLFQSYRGNTTNQGLSTNSWTKVLCNYEVSDTSSAYDGTTGRFTANVAGWYSFTASAQLNGSGGSRRFVSLWKNNSSIGYFQIRDAGTGDVRIEITRLAYLNGSTDFVEAYVYTEATSGVSIGADAQGAETKFEGHLVRAGL